MGAREPSKFRSHVAKGRPRIEKALALYAALIMVIAGGLYQRWVLQADAAIHRVEALSDEALARMPLEIEDWKGREHRLPEAVVAISDTQAHLSRIYQSPGGGQVFLYVGYGVDLPDLMPHRPEVCYVSAGWTRENSESLEIGLPEGGGLPCKIERFLMAGNRATVLSYYLVNGQRYGDVLGLQAEIRRARHSGESWGYAVQVQVAGFGAAELAMRDGKGEEVRQFAAVSAAAIQALFQEESSENAIEATTP